MNNYKYFIITLLALIIISCGGENTSQRQRFSIQINSKSVALGDTLRLSIDYSKKTTIQKVSYQLNGTDIDSVVVLNDIRLGKNQLSAKVTADDKTTEVYKTLEILNNKKPVVYTYEILNTYPHDINSYTQGLEFYNKELYESTGQYKASKLRKVDFETGEVLKNINLDDAFFGEGLTVFNNHIYQLTWRSKTGFIYDVNSFKKISTFKYGKSKEGWGLCNDGTKLYKSDGTEKIWVLNPENLTEEDHIQVYTDKGKIPSLNELEWIDGKLFANIYQRNGVIIINPKNGAVEGVIDFKPLRKLVTPHQNLDVLNGIAYHPERNSIFVTGKNWDKLFEIRIQER